MSLHIEPFVANDSNIEGLKIINAKMVTDDRGTVRELFRDSIYFEVLPETSYQFPRCYYATFYNARIKFCVQVQVLSCLFPK